MDRDVILARKGVPFQPIDFTQCDSSTGICPLPSADGCNYQVVAAQDLTLHVSRSRPARSRSPCASSAASWAWTRWWATSRTGSSPPTSRRGSRPSVRPARYYQTAQAYRAAAGPSEALQAAPSRRQIVVGDMNSDPRDIDGGPRVIGCRPTRSSRRPHTDIWTKRPGAATGKGAPLVGFSCCQAEDLATGSRSCTSGST